MDLLNFIESRDSIILDGAMGTELARRGCAVGAEASIADPEAVCEVHREYIGSGSDILTANSLTMNRIYIESHGLDIDVQAVNQAAADLARQCATGDRYVLGNLSSTGQQLEPYGTYKEDDVRATFAEQAEILAGAGVDGFLIETMFDLREALCALRACRELALPTVVSMTYGTLKNGGRTIMGDSVTDCASRIGDEGADVIGANCGELEPVQVAEVVALLREATYLPILAQPNAGLPRLEGDVTVYDMTPDQFAAGAAQCAEAGACLVGGCCGTSPAHITALAAALELARPTDAAASSE